MKKIFTFCAFIGIAVSVFPAQEEVQVYSYLYNSVSSSSEQLEILQGMIGAKVSGAGAFYARALRQLVSVYPKIDNADERQAAEEQAMLLAAQLGVEKFAAASADLWTVVVRFTDSQARAEALIAIGKIRATRYLPPIVRFLNRLNAEPTSNRQAGERLAFGAIISLEKFADPSGYLPVFFAANGWYSDRIKKQAGKSLAFIAGDPEPYLADIINNPDYDYQIKNTALQTAETSGMSPGRKAAMAALFLSQGWKDTGGDKKMAEAQAALRKISLGMIERYGSSDKAVYPLLERSYTEGFDANEKLSAVSALAAQQNEQAALLLVKILTDLDERQKNGKPNKDGNSLAQAIIPALGAAGNPAAIPVLTNIQKSTWLPDIKNLAKQAARDIQKKKK